jgi:glycosyltransferase involved in cell wall biosynthesis
MTDAPDLGSIDRAPAVLDPIAAAVPRPVLVYIASRWPWPVRTGRQRMIDQSLRFAAQAYDVHLFVHAAAPASTPPDGAVRSVTVLPPPRWREMAMNYLLGRAATLQDALFLSPAGRRHLAAAVDRLQPQVVLFDMARMAGYDAAVTLPPGCRRIVDLDDLLSCRYAQMSRCAPGQLLGAYAPHMPDLVRRAAAAVPRLLAGIESRLMAQRESQLTRIFDTVLLVSAAEAAKLAQRTGARNIAIAPPAIEPRQRPAAWQGCPLRFVFLGGSSFAPNAEALRLLSAIGERLFARGLRLSFQAIGENRAELSLHHVRFLGEVANLDQEMGRGAILVAPIQTGTGIKTKVLEAMARGVPVITTALGLDGLAAVPGRHAVLAETVEGFADAVAAALGSPAAIEKIGLAGYHYAARHHAAETLETAFLAVLRGDAPVSA